MELTLFELTELTTLEPVGPAPAKQLATMYARHGQAEGRTCGNCQHLVRGEYNTQTYFKCKNYTPWTHGPGTDWRKKWNACGLYKENE